MAEELKIKQVEINNQNYNIHAEWADKDENGNDIITTYATKEEVTSAITWGTWD